MPNERHDIVQKIGIKTIPKKKKCKKVKWLSEEALQIAVKRREVKSKGEKVIKEIEGVGSTFNPEYHEAVSLVQDEALGEKEIKEVFRKGYKIGEKVIRHSMVVVAN